MRRLALILAAAALGIAAPGIAQDNMTAPVLVDAASLGQMRAEADRYPLFAAELRRMREEIDGAMRAGINVPVPKDPGGGFTHEQHKRNYRSIYGAGLLYRLTGEQRYRDFARDLLLAYAKLYPTLGPHPSAANQVPGRLFWQSLNDSVWLVHAIQGYEAIRDSLTAGERRTIDDNVFRRMTAFQIGEKAAFDRIHNHATWATAGVGMTGYVLRDSALVEMALTGSDRSGKGGFLRQLDLLFSPDGYYSEGPYYQRYALQPFVVFAQAIEANEPSRSIFKYRNGIILKAVNTAIQLTYDGYFFPLNDAMPDKSLKTEELYQGVAVAYGATKNPALLSIAQWQVRTVLSPQGLAVARDLAAGRARPFPFASLLLRDGPDGDQGALAILRSGPAPTDQVIVAKSTAQGMGHGHFDKLNWLLYDQGNAIVTDYGAARFLNVEAKDGGRYLPENESWAKQTVAHNTLVVDETSHFGGKLKLAETRAPTQIAFIAEGKTRISTAEIAGAYPGVSFRRTLIQAEVDGLAHPLVVDLLKVKGEKAARYDLPLHYSGHLIDAGFKLDSNLTARPVLGAANGYQHLWVDASGRPEAANGRVTWINAGRFYSWRTATPGAEVILAESGANDPRFNLRREPVIIQRLDAAKDTTFISLIEAHGRYDASSETTVGSHSSIRALNHLRAGDADVVTVELVNGRQVVLAIADDPNARTVHEVRAGGRTLRWTGHFGRFDGAGKGSGK